jgi:nitrite reductase/ring-hydroxylating ferredoxin subunit
MKAEHNELLTRTGPGTPMGELFRRYWQPILLSWELPQPDCPPVRLKLLGERMVAFRDTQGRLGLVDEFCAHRGVSLWFGRNEESGLRCPYPGWKYDVTGQCVEVPSEPRESGFCQKVKLKSYPLVERGDLLWVYMGPPDQQPPLPRSSRALSHYCPCARPQRSRRRGSPRRDWLGPLPRRCWRRRACRYRWHYGASPRWAAFRTRSLWLPRSSSASRPWVSSCLDLCPAQSRDCEPFFTPAQSVHRRIPKVSRMANQ